ncbi:MAG: hypothetical protein ACE5GC_02395 [Acidimicrobiia bacterium]
MVDWKKRIEKHASDQLDTDELILAGLPVQPAGYVAQQAGVAGAGGGVVGFLAGSKAKKRREAETEAPTGKASAFPKDAIILAVSNRRLLAFKQHKMSGKPQALLAGYALAEVSSISTEKRKLSNAVYITFDDGSVVDLDSMKGQKVEPLIAAFEGASG